jgi:hypothetical protein
VGPLLDQAVQELDSLAADEALRDLWLTGQGPSLTEFQRLRNLAVLLSVLGPEDALSRVMADLRQMSNATARFIEERSRPN